MRIHAFNTVDSSRLSHFKLFRYSLIKSFLSKLILSRTTLQYFSMLDSDFFKSRALSMVFVFNFFESNVYLFTLKEPEASFQLFSSEFKTYPSCLPIQVGSSHPAIRYRCAKRMFQNKEVLIQCTGRDTQLSRKFIWRPGSF